MPKRYYKYDKNGSAIFLKNDEGDEIYAIHEKTGDEIYPRKGHPFAKNRFGLEYYAKNSKGIEKYPIRNGKSVLIYKKNNVPVIPKEISGKEIYPTTNRGDEYYLVNPENKTPQLLKDENGDVFFARTRSGVKMIPRNYFFKDYEQQPTMHYFLNNDAAKNNVYSENAKISNNIFECICTNIISIRSNACKSISRLKSLCACF